MRSKLTLGIIASLTLSVLASGCGEYVEQGRSPARVVIGVLEAASGAKPAEFGGVLNSDVITNVTKTVNSVQVQVPTIFADLARVSMTLVLRDQGQGTTVNTPSALNQVTFTRYRVAYRRADGRNTPGVDVPYGFDSAATFTVPATGISTVNIELVRHTAKEEAPLAALANNATIISTIADISFYGRDLAGNDVTVTGSIGVFFGNFGDPN